MTADLFAESRTLALDPGAMLLGGFALGEAKALLAGIEAVAAAAPFRHMTTRGGGRMSVAMTNCGQAGWVTDARGYHYAPADPLSGEPWPAMPPLFRALAIRAAGAAGHAGFDPDACLVNLYRPGARMAPHQDIDERDMGAPIVSVSLGLSATFLWGGAARGDARRRLRIDHGDVLVWGGPARRTFHGIAPLAEGLHPDTGAVRYNLTFRRAL